MSYTPPRAGFLAAIIVAGAVGAVAGFAAWRAFLYEPPAPPRVVSLVPDLPPPPSEELIGTRRPDLTLPDVDGRARALDEWQGKVLVVNFWATWCAPCREEMPMLVDLQREYGERGLQVIGVALDKADAVRRFAETYQIDYPLLVGEQDVMEAGRRYGNELGALPYTAIVGRDGRIAVLKTGLLKRDTLTAQVLELL